MKTSNKIKKGLKCCGSSDGSCMHCPYVDGGSDDMCQDVLMGDTLAYIKQLENGGRKRFSFRSWLATCIREFADIVSKEDGIKPAVTGETSDGYHTFNELYHHRAVLFSVIVKTFPEKAWKSRQHSDGSMFDGMFIVGIDTSNGPATYHYDINPYWDMFACKELNRAPEWDGHTAADAIERIGKLEPTTQR